VDGFSMGLGSSNSMLAGLNVGQLGASAKYVTLLIMNYVTIRTVFAENIN